MLLALMIYALVIDFLMMAFCLNFGAKPITKNCNIVEQFKSKPIKKNIISGRRLLLFLIAQKETQIYAFCMEVYVLLTSRNACIKRALYK